MAHYYASSKLIA
ncbi:hypothetical protein CISIN_1g0443342mg, partial [Citrus sinensis]